MLKYKKNLVEIFGSFALYWSFAAILYFIPVLKSGPLTYYLFLPAAVKLFTILIFRWRAVIGISLAVFSRLELVAPEQSTMSWLMIAVFTTLAIYLMIELDLKLLRVDGQLSNLKYSQVVFLALLTSLTNGFTFSYSVSHLTAIQVGENIFHGGFLAGIGSFAGNALIVCFLVLILKQKTSILNFIKGIKNWYR